MKIKTSELEGVKLDWAVGIAAGEKVKVQLGLESYIVVRRIGEGQELWNPSTNWGQGGLLLEGCDPWVSPPCLDPDEDEPYGWDVEIYDKEGEEKIGKATACKSLLIAACRAIVASKLGDTVDVPEELL